MNVPALLLLVGFIYGLLLGGLALIRREGLSGQFAIEAVVITLLVSGIAYFTGYPIHPVFLLVLLYLVTMRARLLVDLGIFIAHRGNEAQAERCFLLALRLWPDHTNRSIVLVNYGTHLLMRGEVDQAIEILKDVLQKKAEGHLGVKYEAAAHYNLGVAYRKKAMDTQATLEFNTVIDIFPASEYARRAANALSQKSYKD